MVSKYQGYFCGSLYLADHSKKDKARILCNFLITGKHLENSKNARAFIGGNSSMFSRFICLCNNITLVDTFSNHLALINFSLNCFRQTVNLIDPVLILFYMMLPSSNVPT